MTTIRERFRKKLTRGARRIETMNIEIGDRVRSYDFEFNRTAYVEGIVTAIRPAEPGECSRYEIKVEKRFLCGGLDHSAEWIGRKVYPPVNGTPRLFGERPTDFVERV